MGNQKPRGVYLETKCLEEITLQLAITDMSTVYMMLSRLGIEVLATSEHVAFCDKNNSGKLCIWLNDVGNSVRNAIASGLFGNKVKLINKSKGERKLCVPHIMSAYELQTFIQTLQRDNVNVVSHTSSIQSGTQCVFFS